MPENKGFYQKYLVQRADGKPIAGRTFTLEIDRDPFAIPALQAYRDAMVKEGGYDCFVTDINLVLAELIENT
jgi:hypothetical protein